MGFSFEASGRAFSGVCATVRALWLAKVTDRGRASSTHVFWSHKETSEIPLSSSTPGWQGCTPNIVEIRSLCLRRRRIFLSLPDLEKGGMLLVGRGFRMAIKGLSLS